MHAKSPQALAGFISFTTLLFILFVAALASAAIGQWQGFYIFSVPALLLFLAIGCGPIPRLLCAHLQKDYAVAVSEPPTASTAIILLGAGVTLQPVPSRPVPAWEAHSRIEQAVQHYLATKRAGFPCTILIAGGDRAGMPPVYTPRLIALGVAPTDIVLETTGVNSFQHAQFIQQLLAKCSYDKLFLVTSGLHMKRALFYFAHFRVQPEPLTADYVTGVLSPFPRGFNFAVTEIAWHQFVGLARLKLYNALGWN